MGFGGGGSAGMTAHVHNNVPLQGGPLDFANDTISSMNAGSTTFSNGAALQELVIGAAGESLIVNGGATAPEWGTPAVGGGEVCVQPLIEGANGLRNNVPRFGVEVLTNDLSIGKTLTDVSFYLQNGGATGLGEARVYDSGGSLQATSTTTKDWATLPGSPTWEKVTFDISHVVAAGDRIVIAGGTTGAGAEVSVNHSAGSQEALSQTYSTLYDVDFQACVEYNSASSTWNYASSLTSCVKWCYTTS